MTGLTDRFGRRHTALRLSLTERCNLRCVYCMPAEGVPLTPTAAMLTTDEIERLVRVFVGAGVDAVRLTGGEPLARKDAVDVAARLGRLGLRKLALTTNGLLLADRLLALRDAGVTHLTVSLDTLRADRFLALTRRAGLDRVLAAIDAALDAGYAIGTARPLKLNVVGLRATSGAVGNTDEAADFADLAARLPIEVRFIELMPFAGNGWDRAALVPMAETRAAVEAVHGPLTPLGDAPESTAQTVARPGWAGRIGFVASMTAPFCAGCNRLRLTADGRLRVCLFGRDEASLRDALRVGATDGAVLALVRAALAGKHAAHAGLDLLGDGGDGAATDRPMITIGG